MRNNFYNTYFCLFRQIPNRPVYLLDFPKATQKQKSINLSSLVILYLLSTIKIAFSCCIAQNDCYNVAIIQFHYHNHIYIYTILVYYCLMIK